MHSLFARARTTSTKNLPKAPYDPDVAFAGGVGGGPDEFGRVNSRPPPTPSKGDKKTKDDRRSRAQSTTDKGRRSTNATSAYSAAGGDASFDGDALVVEDGYLPTQPGTRPEEGQQGYGYLSYESHIVLGVEDVTKLVEVIAEELGARGLTTPFLLSNNALDISTHTIKRLILSFLYFINPSLLSPASQRGLGVSFSDFRDEARFAGPHELGMVLRWGLARVVRISKGVEGRGLIAWDIYLAWRRIEQESNYDKTEFASFVQLVPFQIRSLLLTLLGLLQRLLANSTSSGLTPPALASYFGPLLFGLNNGVQQVSGSLSFPSSYTSYLRACHATEHVLLAFVRLQIAQTPPSSAPPRRLISWVAGYPAMLASPEALDRGMPRRDAKTVRVASVRRNVRMYTNDLVLSGVGWAKGPDGVNMRNTKLWNRVSPAIPEDKMGERMLPRYTDTFRKKMDLPTNYSPLTGTSSGGSALSTPSLSTSSTASSKSLEEFGLSLGGLGFGGGGSGEEKFRSLTDKRWGDFETLGFGEADGQKLQFDLNESARTARNVKRTTLTWADFSAAGFTRTESSLSATLQFSQPVASNITQWPEHDKELSRKLKKAQKNMPTFGWDTEPVMDGREEIIEEGFIDVFCDLIYGGGWMDRGEEVFRDCNWALAELKSLPSSRTELKPGTTSVSPNAASDPRTSSVLLLFEEFVPAEYRAALASQGNKPARTRLVSIPNLLSPNKNKANKQAKAATINGRIGSSSRREAEFERLISGGGSVVTKVLTLDTAKGTQPRTGTPLPGEKRTAGALMSIPGSNASAPALQRSPVSSQPAPPLPDISPQKMTSPTTRRSRFKFPGSSSNRQGMLIPAEYDTVDFETRDASYSDDDLNDDAGRSKAKRLSKDDAWVDILVASNANRMADQDAELRPVGNSKRGLTVSGGSGGRSDPELASQEVAQALAAVRQLPPTDDEGDGGWDPRRNRPQSEFEDFEPASAKSFVSKPEENIVDDDAESTVTFPQKKRLGYFDLHPERLQVERTDVQDGDSHSAEYHDRSMTDRDYQYAPSARSTTFSGDYEPGEGDSIRVADDGDVEAPAFIDVDPTPPRFDSSKTITDDAATQSKTAALIEIYRERERQQQAQQAQQQQQTPVPLVAPLAIQPKPSRLPVRALPQPPGESSSSPAPVEEPEDGTGTDDTSHEELPLSQPAVPFVANELGRASPQRYVHGAPLHNVLEEEEE